MCNKAFVYSGGTTVYNGCTVRLVYRIFEYSFVLGIFDSLGFRIFVLALVFAKEWWSNTPFLYISFDVVYRMCPNHKHA